MKGMHFALSLLAGALLAACSAVQSQSNSSAGAGTNAAVSARTNADANAGAGPGTNTGTSTGTGSSDGSGSSATSSGASTGGSPGGAGSGSSDANAPAATVAPVQPAEIQAGTAHSAAAAAGQGNVELGRKLAMQGNGQGAAACSSCHGAKGEGNAQAQVPRIGGQPGSYLAKQLHDYAGGARKNDIMQPIAKSLSDEEREAAASYYARLPAPALPTTEKGAVGKQHAATAGSRAKAMPRGQQLVTVGDEALRVQACGNCHGPGASGLNKAGMPYLAGQNGNYLRAALEAWRTGARRNDPTGQMPTIASRLRPEDVDALVKYLGSEQSSGK